MSDLPGTTPGTAAFAPLPGVPEEEVFASIVSNEPTPDDPYYVRHLKTLTVRNMQERLSRHSSQNSRNSGTSWRSFRKTRVRQTSEGSTNSGNSTNSRTTRSIASSSDTISSLDEDSGRPFLLRNNTLVLLLTSSVAVFGVFWSIQAVFILELIEHTGVDLKLMGYLFSCIRIGKLAGHVIFVPVTSFLTSNLTLLGSVTLLLFGGVVVTVPLCRQPILLGALWFFLGCCYGVLDSDYVQIIQMLNPRKRSIYTNLLYAIYGISGFAITFILKHIQNNVTGIFNELMWSFGINGAVALAFSISLALLHLVRVRNKVNLVPEEAPLHQQVAVKFKSFQHYYISFTLLVLSGFFIIFNLSTMWNFILVFARNSRASLTENQSFAVVQVFYGAMMAVRVAGVAIVFSYKNTTVILLATNGVLLCGCLCSSLLRDNLYEGIILTAVFFGAGIGMFHQSLLNWLQDHIIITPSTTLPFFLASTSGFVAGPSVVPHIISNEKGEVLPDRFLNLITTLSFLSVFLSTILVSLERIKEERVEDIELIPSLVNARASARISSLMKPSPSVRSVSTIGTAPRSTSTAPAERTSRMSRVSAGINQQLDPILSFIGSLN